MSNLPQAFAFIAIWEWSNRKDGGYTNDASDPGGETKWGISKKAYPDIDIKSLTKEEAFLIYERDYWLKAGCDKMEKALAIAVFDSAVNCGVGRTRSWLVELEKEKERNPQRSARWMIQRRTQYYLDLVKRKPALNKYIKGWLNRVNDLSKYVDIVCQNT
jgi:lysozyme family protein